MIKTLTMMVMLVITMMMNDFKCYCHYDNANIALWLYDDLGNWITVS